MIQPSLKGLGELDCREPTTGFGKVRRTVLGYYHSSLWDSPADSREVICAGNEPSQPKRLTSSSSMRARRARNSRRTFKAI